MDGHSGAELLVELSCLDTEGIDVETGTETGGDIMYASVLLRISNNEWKSEVYQVTHPVPVR